MMQRYDPHHPQVVASQPHDGFYFEPVTHGDRARETVQREELCSLTPVHAQPGEYRQPKDVR
ncbi:MAG: hypothetical protein ACRCT4_06250 [Silvania sp.]